MILYISKIIEFFLMQSCMYAASQYVIIFKYVMNIPPALLSTSGADRQLAQQKISAFIEIMDYFRVPVLLA